MTEIVERVKSETWTNRDNEEVTSYRVTLVDGAGQREVPCYDPRGRDLAEDAPLPDGWEVRMSKAGKLYLAAPKPPTSGGYRSGGAPAAWRNTEAGAKYEQERMDRRTALMQAVAIGSGITTDLAEKFYRWLRESVSAPGGEQPLKPVVRDSALDRPVPGADTPVGEGGGSGYEDREVAGKAADDPAKNLETAPPPPVPSHAEKWTPEAGCPTCHQAWGPNTTATGKRVCVGGHVEKFDAREAEKQ